MTTGVNRLKELLFEPEAQRLAEVQRRIDALSDEGQQRHQDTARRHGELQARVDAVFERAGTEERLQKSVAGIIDGALREAEVTKHEQLSRAIAPLVVKTIKFELKNSQDEMVDALYPLTGRLVKQYVQTAVADMMADINRRLGGAKPSDLERRAKELGLTVGELVLAETQALKVDELFLIRRGSGDLVAHWERPVDGGVVTSAEGSNRDVLIAGYLAGITAFSEEAFDDKKGTLRSIDMQGERIFVRASPAYLIAARCSGSAPASIERIIDDVFVQVVSELNGGGDGTALDGLLPHTAATLEERFAAERQALETRARAAAGQRPGLGRLYALLALILLPIVAWFAWSSWQAWQAARVLGEARRVLASTTDMRGFPVLFDVTKGGRFVTVSGLAPSEAVRATFMTELRTALPDTRIDDMTGLLPRPPVVAPVVAPGPDLTGDVEALRRGIAALSQQTADARQRADAAEQRLAELAGRITPVPGQITTLEQHLPELRARAAAIDAEVRRLDQRIDGLPRPLVQPAGPSARDQLDAFIRAHAIFFANGTDFLDEARALDAIDKLAVLIRADAGVVRIVGYTDERGTATSNAQLALARADRVAQLLIARDVPRERLAVVGRSSGPDLSRMIGVGSPNRRVAFELGFVDEPVP